MINYLSQQKNWQSQLSDTINRVDELLTLLELPQLLETSYNPRQNNFPLRVPRAFVEKMQKGDPNDPLLLQVLPDKRALQQITGYVTDPLAENEHNPQQGLIHKYQSRVLITVTGACAIHCRYCFRQHFDYKANTPNSKKKQTVLDYIRTQENVNEVILSGGDPLSLNNQRLFSWLNDLAELEQINTIRIHTRFPVVIPERLDDELLDFFTNMNAEKVRLIMVIHCNHANEIDDNTASYLTKLQKTGVSLLNQAVLLKGVNDTVEAQVALSHRLFQAGVLPYYLFVLDKVAGASYFDHDEKFAIDLYWQMIEHLSGYLVPKLAREIANKPFKTPIDVYSLIR